MSINGAMRRCIRRCVPFEICGRNRYFLHIADERSGSCVEYREVLDCDWGWIRVTVGGVCVATVHLVQLTKETRSLSGCVEVLDVSKKVYQNRILSVLGIFFPDKHFDLVPGMIRTFDRVGL